MTWLGFIRLPPFYRSRTAISLTGAESDGYLGRNLYPFGRIVPPASQGSTVALPASTSRNALTEHTLKRTGTGAGQHEEIE
jgi:hypothetical protein